VLRVPAAPPDAVADAENVAVAPAGKLAMKHSVSKSPAGLQANDAPLLEVMDPVDQLRPSWSVTQTLASGDDPVLVTVTLNETAPPGATCDALGVAEIVIAGGGGSVSVFPAAGVGAGGDANPLDEVADVGRFVAELVGASRSKPTEVVPERSA
jgi:hypothetical protein